MGARVRAPTLSGEVEVSIAPGANGGRVLRLRGKGLPGGAEQAAGDLLATLRIVLPNEPDAELTALDAEDARSEALPASLRHGLSGLRRRVGEVGRDL